MLEKLKIILKGSYIDENNVNQPHQILQYKTSNHEVLSLRKDRLTQEQINLLDLFLTPLHKEVSNETPNEIYWRTLISTGTYTAPPPFPSSMYRFTHFTINGKLNDENEFKEALAGLFQKEVTVVWRTNLSGFIVEYITNEEDEIEGNSLVEAIMTDFYVKIAIYHGSLFINLADAKGVYEWEQAAFSLSKKVLPNLTVVKKEQLIPFLLTSEASEMTKKMLLQTIHHFKDDKELLKTIKVFFESNLNTTLAAKKLFMHRNSLQYRIDKFIERTGIDIKQFQQAAAIYMLIALDETSEK